MIFLIQLLILVTVLTVRGHHMLGRHLKPVHEGNTNHLTAKATYKGKTTSRHIGLTQQNGLTFIIRSEKWYHRLLKNLGIASEVQLNHAAFDQHYFISSDLPHHLESVLHSTGLREHVYALFSLGIKSLHATSSKIWFSTTIDDKDQPEAFFAPHRELLAKISKATHKTPDYSVSTDQPKNRSVLAFVFMAVHCAILSIGFVGIWPQYVDAFKIVDKQEFLITIAMVASAAIGSWLFLIFTVFRKSSWVCMVLFDFLLVGIAGIVLFSAYSIREANITLSQPAPQIHHQPVLQKTCNLHCSKRCGKNCHRTRNFTFHSEAECNLVTRSQFEQEKNNSDPVCRSSSHFQFKLKVQHWKQNKPFEFSPSVTLFDRIRVGQQLAIPVNEGALGLDWVNTDNVKPD